MSSNEERAGKSKAFRPPCSRAAESLGEGVTPAETKAAPVAAGGKKRRLAEERDIKREPGAKRRSRAQYSEQENCQIFDQVLGGCGIFNRDPGVTKDARWASIANVVSKKLSEEDSSREAINGGALRKHVEGLIKKYKGKRAADRKKSGKCVLYPNQSHVLTSVGYESDADRSKLEQKMDSFIGRQDAENAAKHEKAAAKKAKSGTTAAGLEIRRMSLQGEPRKSSSSDDDASSDESRFTQPTQRSAAVRYLQVTYERQEEKEKEERERQEKREKEERDLRMRQYEQEEKRRELESARFEAEMIERRHQRELHEEQLKLMRELQENLMVTVTQTLQAIGEMMKNRP